HDGACALRHIISDRLDFGRCSPAHSVAVSANRVAFRLDFGRGRSRQADQARNDHVALVGNELAHRLAATCFGIDYLGLDDCLAALCESIAHLSRCERSRRFFTRRYVPFATHRLRGAITFAKSASIKHNALSLPFVQNVRSHSQERLMASLPAPAAHIASSPSTLPSPLIAAAAWFVLSFCN